MLCPVKCSIGACCCKKSRIIDPDLRCVLLWTPNFAELTPCMCSVWTSAVLLGVWQDIQKKQQQGSNISSTPPGYSLGIIKPSNT